MAKGKQNTNRQTKLSLEPGGNRIYPIQSLPKHHVFQDAVVHNFGEY